ncbi:unannotated protein [freshwater metagenome]|uniref:Unannotated protein n=1 Tax=freshwater metagenome TaxID=449393 RepID=A0A6J7A3C2_9ZZZZ|nr:hypothetical protein [Actinomycetota bacterium]
MIEQMLEIEKFQVRGLPGNVHKVRIGQRMIDYWAPRNPGRHILVAHDGQGVLDRRNVGINPRYRATWELAQSSIRIAEKQGLIPPTVICIYHTPFEEDSIGRLKDYTPAQYMSKKEDWFVESFGVYQEQVDSFINHLSADQLIDEIANVIVPEIAGQIGQEIDTDKTAILGASMGGLASIYSVIKRPDFFTTALSFSPHWIIGQSELAEKMLTDFPSPGSHKLWMSRGTKGLDARYEQAQNLADKVIRERGYVDNRDLITRILNRGSHTNATWARYVPAALDFWMRRA